MHQFNYDAQEAIENRQNDHFGISINLPTLIAKQAKEIFLNAEWAQEIPDHMLLRNDNSISVYFYQLDDDACKWLRDRMNENGYAATANIISSLCEANNDPINSTINNLMVLTQALSAYIKKDAIDGWLYTMGEGGEPLPWLITNIAYQEMSNGQHCVAIRIKANTVAMSNNDYSRPNERMLYFFAQDAVNKRVADILAEKGFIKETPELKKSYTESLERFVKFVPQINKQFVAEKSGLEVDLSERYQTPVFLKFAEPAKVINDEELVKRKFFTHADSPFWRLQGHGFSEIPIHPMILCFNLDTHTNMWIHVNNLTEYRYDSSLREKLVLPPQHRDLIDILTQDMDILMGDIVSGKSGGTTILCKGAPGLGKTLTAEVYSEVVERPLYRVHSGQLGIRAEEVEKNLEDILKRAQRWGAVMLLDEADVYIRKRGNDIDHNAVVASFLRTLEYFHGLLFMTTNRSDDVDDAIASRCIATIQYEPPKGENAKRIWKVLSNQFELALPDPLIDDLIVQFNEVSGRDIKELLKLTAKWCRQKNTQPSLEVFKSCAQFRGL